MQGIPVHKNLRKLRGPLISGSLAVAHAFQRCGINKIKSLRERAYTGPGVGFDEISLGFGCDGRGEKGSRLGVWRSWVGVEVWLGCG